MGAHNDKDKRDDVEATPASTESTSSNTNSSGDKGGGGGAESGSHSKGHSSGGGGGHSKKKKKDKDKDKDKSERKKKKKEKSEKKNEGGDEGGSSSSTTAAAAAASGGGGGGGEDEGVIFSQNKQKVSAADFELLKIIGKGSFGTVMQVKKKDDGRIYAMKVLNKQTVIDRKQVFHTKTEKSVLQQINNPFIVKLHYAFQTADKLYMVLDYANGGELFFHLKEEGTFSEERVIFYSAEIALALKHLHSLGIVYRDLKPENILLNKEGHVVITDFGLSKQLVDDESTHTFCGTPEYLAPEVLRGQGHGFPVDWWSLGTLIFEMLTGLPPFYSTNTNAMYQKILSGEVSYPPEVSPACRSLLEGLLTKDPKKRFGAEQIMSHPWYAAIDWDKLARKEVKPPWIPPVKSAEDTTQIDPMFLDEPIKKEDTKITQKTVDDDFNGFTFVGNSELDDGGGGGGDQ